MSKPKQTKSDLIDTLQAIGILIALVIGLYIGVCRTIWPWRNPKANSTTFWTEMPAPLRFERLEKYQ